MHQQFKSFFFVICLAIFLASCGGGNSNSSASNNSNVATINSLSTTDTPAPTVIMYNILNGATNVPTTQSIILEFSESVNNVNTSTVTLHEDSTTGPIVPLNNPIAGSYITYSFKPVSTLKQATKYYVVVNNGITSVKTGIALTPITFNFSTGTFATPTVSMLTPSNGDTNVSEHPIIQLQFNQFMSNVNSTTLSIHLNSPTGFLVDTQQPIRNDTNNSYTFIPIKEIPPHTPVYVVLNGVISANSGESLAPTTFNFTTSSSSAPTVAMINPINGAINVTTDSPWILLQFSIPVNNVSSQSVALHEGSETGPIVQTAIGLFNENNNIYHITPIHPLDSSKQYFVTLNYKITSAYDGEELQNTVFNFTTK